MYTTTTRNRRKLPVCLGRHKCDEDNLCARLNKNKKANPMISLRAARHQAAMLRSLKEVQADDNVVGFYQATALGGFFTQSLVKTQAIHQRVLRHGGVVIVHGEF